MSHEGKLPVQNRTPYTRWERSLEHGSELVCIMQHELVKLGSELLEVKPSDTATVSIATAPNFKNAAIANGIELNYPELAARFLVSTNRTALKRTTAEPQGIGFIQGRNSPGNDSRGLRIVLNFSS